MGFKSRARQSSAQSPCFLRTMSRPAVVTNAKKVSPPSPSRSIAHEAAKSNEFGPSSCFFLPRLCQSAGKRHRTQTILTRDISSITSTPLKSKNIFGGLFRNLRRAAEPGPWPQMSSFPLARCVWKGGLEFRKLRGGGCRPCFESLRRTSSKRASGLLPAALK